MARGAGKSRFFGGTPAPLPSSVEQPQEQPVATEPVLMVHGSKYSHGGPINVPASAIPAWEAEGWVIYKPKGDKA